MLFSMLVINKLKVGSKTSIAENLYISLGLIQYNFYDSGFNLHHKLLKFVEVYGGRHCISLIKSLYRETCL